MKGTLVRTPRWCVTDKTLYFFGVSERIRIFDRKEMTDGAPFLKESHGQRGQYKSKLILLP